MIRRIRASLRLWLNPVTVILLLVATAFIGLVVSNLNDDAWLTRSHPEITIEHIDSEWGFGEELLKLYDAKGRDAVKARLAQHESLRIHSGWMSDGMTGFVHIEVDGDQEEVVEEVQLTGPPGGLIALLPELQNLRRLQFGHLRSLEHLQLIAAIPGLEELSLSGVIDHVDGQPPEVLKQLQGMQHLRTLDLTGLRFDDPRSRKYIQIEETQRVLCEQLPDLAALPNLKTLILFDYDFRKGFSREIPVTRDLLKSLGKLPQVETLVLSLVLDSPGNMVEESDIHFLRSMTGLKTLYVPVRTAYRDALEPCRRLLPEVSVWRAQVDRQRTRRVSQFVIALQFVAWGVVYQLATTLFSSLSHTTPGYRQFHLLTACMVVGLFCLTCSFIIAVPNAAFFPALSLLVACSVLFTDTWRNLTPFRWEQGRILRPLVGYSMVLTVPPLLIVTPSHFLAWYDAWLAGDWPLAAVALLVVATGRLLYLPASIRRQTARAAESGVSSFAGLSGVFQASGRAQQRRRDASRIISAGQALHLDKLLDSLPQNAQRRMKQQGLVEAAGQNCSAVLVLVGFLMIGMMVLIRFVFPDRGLSPKSDLYLSIMLPTITLAVVQIITTSVEWRQRMAMTQVESLRPVSRLTLRWLYFRTIALHVMPFAVTASGFGLGLLIAFGNRQDGRELSAMLLAIGPLIYGLSLWNALIRRAWLALLLCILLTAGWLAVSDLLQRDGSPLSGIPWVTTAAAFILSLTLVYTAWSHWPRRELA